MTIFYVLKRIYNDIFEILKSITLYNQFSLNNNEIPFWCHKTKSRDEVDNLFNIDFFKHFGTI